MRGRPSPRSPRDDPVDRVAARRDAVPPRGRAARMDEVAYRRARARRRARTCGSRETVAALEAGDLAEVGRLFAASHASLRDRFEVVSPELDAMVEIAIGRARASSRRG